MQNAQQLRVLEFDTRDNISIISGSVIPMNNQKLQSNNPPFTNNINSFAVFPAGQEYTVEVSLDVTIQVEEEKNIDIEHVVIPSWTADVADQMVTKHDA